MLFKARPPMVDAFDFLAGKPVTHANGSAYDRILVSDAIVKGSSGLRVESVSIQKHSRGKGTVRRLYTDHFAVSLMLLLP